MNRVSCWIVLAASLFFTPNAVFAQGTTGSATATCNYDPDKQLDVEYQRVTVNPKKRVLGGEIPYGKVWTPGGKPMSLFTNTPVTVAGKELPIGAYTMFVIPEENKWTLILSKSTDTSGKYDEAQDLVRVPMQFGKLEHAEAEFSAYFAHVAADKCNLRLDLEKARAWVDFEKK